MIRKAIIASAAIAALAASVTTAAAMPVRNVHVAGANTNTITVSANAYSPPEGACGAYYGIRILNGDHGGRVVRSRFGRFNACQVYAQDESGWSMGTFRATFNVANLPVGTYRVCVGAGNTAYVGGLHAICRFRSF